mgnify:CR=1 FL=1
MKLRGALVAATMMALPLAANARSIYAMPAGPGTNGASDACCKPGEAPRRAGHSGRWKKPIAR